MRIYLNFLAPCCCTRAFSHFIRCQASQSLRQLSWTSNRNLSARPATLSFSSRVQARVRSEGDERGGRIRGPLSSVDTVIPEIQWYPGHIAKAERNLQASLRVVDVVIELRDARIPISTAHPKLKEWLGGKSRILVFGHADLVSGRVRGSWREWMLERGEQVRFVDGKRGKGVSSLKERVIKAGTSVNQRRIKRGMRERPVRCLVVGFPNVGKSALINQLVGRRAAKTEQRPGITRTLQWVRVGSKVEMLDMPGVIPVKVQSRESAIRLAICDEIGEAAYDKQIIAALLVDEIRRVYENWGREWADIEGFDRMFQIPVGDLSGDLYVDTVAKKHYNGDVERVSVRLLKELRRGRLGHIAFESPDMVLQNEKLLL